MHLKLEHAPKNPVRCSFIHAPEQILSPLVRIFRVTYPYVTLFNSEGFFQTFPRSTTGVNSSTTSMTAGLHVSKFSFQFDHIPGCMKYVYTP